MFPPAHLVQSKGLGESEAPALLEGPADHGAAGGGGGGRQAEGVGEVDPAHLHADVHGVDGAVEQRQLRHGAHRLPVERLQGDRERGGRSDPCSVPGLLIVARRRKAVRHNADFMFESVMSTDTKSKTGDKKAKNISSNRNVGGCESILMI